MAVVKTPFSKLFLSTFNVVFWAVTPMLPLFRIKNFVAKTAPSAETF